MLSDVDNGLHSYNIYGGSRSNLRKKKTSTKNTNHDAGIMKTEKAVHSHLVHNSSRLKTFETWRRPPIDYSNLSEAGFAYTGYGDNVICYFCGGKIRNWEVYDDKWFLHASYFPGCLHVKMIKELDYVC